MFLPVNLTLIRGRSGVPMTFLRTRQWRRRARSCLSSVLISVHHGFCHAFCPSWKRQPRALLHRLAFLADDLFARVTDALAFVRFRWIEAADFSRHLSDQLFPWPCDGDLGVFFYRHFDLVGDRVID